MTDPLKPDAGVFLMGNEAIVRGALEAGVQMATGYPGTPSSEIIENLARSARPGQLYVEWSVNETVAMEVAAAASLAQLRALCVMKENGVNVASDFLLHLTIAGTRGGLVLVACDDPGGLSSVTEGESRFLARFLEIPLLEPASLQEAKDMTKWAFELSEEVRNVVLLRSVTRMSHASGNVILGELPEVTRRAAFRYDGPIQDPDTGLALTFFPVPSRHRLQQEKLDRAREIFETSPFNTYEGPEAPELLIITSSACTLYSREAVHLLGAAGRVGILKIGTTWPIPSRLVKSRLARTGRILIVEEVLPFLEDQVKILAAGDGAALGIKTFYGKYDGTLPMVGELNPDIVAAAVGKILDISLPGLPDAYLEKLQDPEVRALPAREQTFCAGCPHRASFWGIRIALQRDDRRGFVCGDIGCYSMAALFPDSGFHTVKTLHAMGSGAGVAGGFGQLGPFGMDQPVLSVCGDSTFFHTSVPALINAVHTCSRMLMIVLDNKGTAMTGFQPHPGLAVDAVGRPAPSVEIEKLCAAIGAGVTVRDPFDLASTVETINDLLEKGKGVQVLVLRQACALSPERKGKKAWNVRIDEAACMGERCGCNRLCTRIFRCPGLVWDAAAGKARIDEVVCTGCGMCSLVCPAGAILREVR